VSGQRYLEHAVVPFTEANARDAVPVVAEPERSMRTSITRYRVEAGDTVLGIAQKFGLKGTSLLYANQNLADNPDFLKLGQELIVLPVDGAYHTVAKGETLASIATKYKVDAEAIREYAGNDVSADGLQVGQALIIPGGVKPYTPRRVVAYNSPKAPSNAQKGTGHFGWPMSGHVTQGYWEGHHAIDIGGPRGTRVLAADAGYVVTAQWSDVGYGRMVIVDHGNGYKTLYAHLDAFFVEVGQSVSKGEHIAKCGSTGNSTGPHLHFEVVKNGVRRNPFIYLP
jgi:murein DD-endopeptidase MepM/ murein hydrolase activator NlpD